MNAEKRKKVLFGILGLFVLIVALKWLPRLLPDSPEPAPDPLSVLDSADRSTTASRRGRRRRASREPARVTEVVEVRLAALESEAAEYTPGRDPFAFYVPPRPPPPPPPPPVKREPPSVVQKPPEVVVPRGPRPPEITFAYIGNFGHSARPIAVFTDGEEIANAFVGDTVYEVFRVVEIGYESVALTYLDFPDLPAARLPVGAEGL